ncbi:MAG: cell envelope integrity protein CreD [Saprospiraceae bacterium]|nr:cell envelope integrity protein CreD [Saprospiraceae bacterium]
MENENKTNGLGKLNKWASTSVTLKLFIIGFLLLLLIVPNEMIKSLINEREQTRNEAVEEVSSKWGRAQYIGCPVISVPYEIVVTNENGKLVPERGFVHFLPENVDIQGDIKPEKRNRGIYVIMLYNSQLKIKGNFGALQLDALTIPKDKINFKDAFITLGISDMKGIKQDVKFKWNDKILECNPGLPTNDVYSAGINVPINLEGQSGNWNFDVDLKINGSSYIRFYPFGKETTVTLNSSWDNPKFDGSFLPDTKQISNKGFDAKWKILHFNRNYPQQGQGNFIGTVRQDKSDGNVAPDYNYNNGELLDNAGTFGVKLLLPVDEYQKTFRSAKYSMMFVIITFLTFFFIEILNKKRLHPIQYLLIGAAVCLFYILLLSISEHLNFNKAYLIACVIILALITYYSKFILKNNTLTFVVAGVLGILYLFFYSLLQLQDYALILGSVGLLVILSTIMYLTRNIDWYKINEE